MARGTTSYYGRRYTIATPMTHLYMLCACIFCWIVGYVDSVGYPVYGEVTAPPFSSMPCWQVQTRISFPWNQHLSGCFVWYWPFISYLPLIMTRTLRIRLITHPWLSVSEVCCGYTSFGSYRCFGWGCIISGHWISGHLSLPCSESWRFIGLFSDGVSGNGISRHLPYLSPPYSRSVSLRY